MPGVNYPLSTSEPMLIIQGIEDDVVRRDTLHATINSLPDPNYATLRALALVRERTPDSLTDPLKYL